MLEYRLLARYHIFVLMDDLFMKTTLAACLAILVSVFKVIEPLVHILLMLLIVDFALDFWVAWRKGTISSFGINKTLVKLILYALACLIIGLAAKAINISMGIPCGIDTWGVCLICINEALSCLSNLSLLGFPVPKWVVNKLQSFNADPTKQNG